jgi:hypothetical protein
MKKSDNPQAFPSEEKDGRGEHFQNHFGMTLRDYFAAKALHGAMTGKEYAVYTTPEELAEVAYIMADAMLKQREL